LPKAKKCPRNAVGRLRLRDKAQCTSAGASLKVVEFAHCRYVHAVDTGVRWPDLLVCRTSSGKRLEQVKIAEWVHQDSSRQPYIGDIA